LEETRHAFEITDHIIFSASRFSKKYVLRRWLGLDAAAVAGLRQDGIV
jgi:hypothetical protein